MTKRLSAGVLLFAVAALVFATSALAEHPSPKEWTDPSDPYRELPVFFRAAAGTTWVQVNDTGGCDPAPINGGGDIHPEGMDSSQVWCFEAPDSLWPAGPNAGSPGLRDTWNHYSRNLPPVAIGSKWHVTTLDGQAPGIGGFFNAWCGCDSLGTNPSCDVSFWVFQKGYGTEWEEVLTLDTSNLGNGSGGTVEFDLRYDTECVYDYVYLEYFNSGSGNWDLVRDGLGVPAVFNGVSGNDTVSANCDNGNDGSMTDGNYFNSETKANGSPFHGNSTWYQNVQFPIPAMANLSLRWRGSSDPGWSDEDGSGDTDGLGAVDNITVTFNNGTVVNDNFETGDFTGVTTTNGGGNSASWSTASAANTYDGWHLSFDPMYKNKGNTCTFSDDWMWAAKPDAGAIPENAFEFFLVSPAIPSVGWTGCTVQWSSYGCFEPARNDVWHEAARIYDSSKGAWGPWQVYNAFFGGCEFWNVSNGVDLSTYLGATTDSLQLGWEVIDHSHPGEFAWGSHAAVQLLVDNVAVGSFDAGGTVFTIGTTGQFCDTFSRADPAHTAFLANPDQGKWIGLSTPNGTTQLSENDSLNVAVTDPDGMTTENMTLWWRVNDGPQTAFGSWSSKAMDFAVQDGNRPPGEGTYRAIIGNDGGGEDYDNGTTGSGAANGFIWKQGQTVEYYIVAVDDVPNAPSYWPGSADPADPDFPLYAEFSVLPMAISTAGDASDGTDANGRPTVSTDPNAEFVLLVDDYLRTTAVEIDWENSTGFNPTGGVGFGAFTNPTFEDPEDQVERALGLLWPGGTSAMPYWDKYDVAGAGSLIQTEPRGVSDVGTGLGAYMTDDPNFIYYDAIIWLNGTFDALAFEDTTRIELETYLNSGGCLFSTGDEVAFDLGSGGNDSDSLIHFGINYFGIDMTNPADDATADKVLNVAGESGSSLDGLLMGLYGECPGRREFDMLTLATPGNGSVAVLARYADSDTASDNGRVAATLTTQNGGGKAACYGFDITALLTDNMTARVLGAFLGTDCGLSVANVVGPNNGVDAPVIANGFGFNLAQARPNPFSDATSIQFSVPTKTHVNIEVFNILGQRVRTLVDENMEANSYVRQWDGRSDAGAQVSSGIYFYKMVAGKFSATKKAVLLK